ncbi:UNVERIFIED_CONTAM: hypothetical protein Sindi_2495800 [Sesamum indicum]
MERRDYQVPRGRILPADPIAAKRVKFWATRFTISGQLYKRTVDGPLLKCLDEERALYVMREIHEGSCENNSTGILLAYVGKGFQGVGEEVRKLPEICVPDTPTCDPNGTDQDSLPVRPVGDRHCRTLPPSTGSEEIHHHGGGIFHQVGRSRGWEKNYRMVKELKIAQHFTAVANPQANRQTEVTNRTILQHLKTRLESKGSWVDELPRVLWAYRMPPRTARGETPFCLVYGTEAIIPAEIGEESQRVAMYDPETNQQERSFDLTVIEEKRDAAYARILHHKGLIMRSHDRRIRPRQLQVGDFLPKEVEASKHVGKLEPPWEGPYKVTEIKKKGTYRLQDMQGRNMPCPWNIQNLKRFYA